MSNRRIAFVTFLTMAFVLVALGGSVPAAEEPGKGLVVTSVVEGWSSLRVGVANLTKVEASGVLEVTTVSMLGIPVRTVVPVTVSAQGQLVVKLLLPLGTADIIHVGVSEDFDPM